MLTNSVVSQRYTVLDPASDHSNINRLMAAAMINKGFCNLLLQNPLGAVRKGFAGESFPLSQWAQSLLISIQADNLPEFAQELSAKLYATSSVTQ